MSEIVNARMYAVTPEVEDAWRGLLERITAEAGVALRYVPYPAPKPMEDLWRRPDLGCVFMCGYPIALRLAPVVPIASPIPRADWAGGRAVYRSDLIVRADAPHATLEDTFGGRAGWTVAHSHSGFNAFRHHLLRFRRPESPKLYREMVGDLVTARAILDGVRDGDIESLARQLQRDFPSQAPGTRRAGYNRYFLVRHGLPQSRTAFSVGCSLKANAKKPAPLFHESAISTHLAQA